MLKEKNEGKNVTSDQQISSALSLAGKFDVAEIISGKSSILAFFQQLLQGLSNGTSLSLNSDILQFVRKKLKQLYGVSRKNQCKEDTKAKLLHINISQHEEIEKILERNIELLSKFYEFLLASYDDFSLLLQKYPDATPLAAAKKKQATLEKAAVGTRKLNAFFPPRPEKFSDTKPVIHETSQSIPTKSAVKVKLWAKKDLAYKLIDKTITMGDTQKAQKLLEEYEAILSDGEKRKLEERLKTICSVKQENVARLIEKLMTRPPNLDKENFELFLRILHEPTLVNNLQDLISIYELWRSAESDCASQAETAKNGISPPSIKGKRRKSGTKKTFWKLLYPSKKAPITVAKLEGLLHELPRKIRDLYIEKAKTEPTDPEILYGMAQLMHKDQKGKEGKEDKDIYFVFVKDLAEARNLLKKAADCNHPAATLEYVRKCIYGIGGEKDLGEAEKYISKLNAEAQPSESNFLRGEIYFYKRKFSVAAEYYAKAAKLKNEEALYCLSLLADNGDEENKKYAANLRDELLQVPELKEWISQLLIMPEPEQTKRNIPDPQQICDEYQRKYTEDAKWYLLTTFLYKHKQRDKNPEECDAFWGALRLLEPSWASASVEKLEKSLFEYEQTSRTYFGEYLSDAEKGQDSDEEDKQHYDGASSKILQHRDHVEDILEKASPDKVLEVIARINAMEASVDDDTEEERISKDIQGIFAKIYGEMVSSSSSSDVLHDLERVNHYASQGKLIEAIPQIITKFRVLQIRGIGYKLAGWTQTHRRQYRRRFKRLHKERDTMKDVGQYSSTVYEKAGIRYGMERTKYERYRLDKWAELLKDGLKEVLAKPYSEDTKIKLGYRYETVNDFVQKDYTESYSKHREHLKDPKIFDPEMVRVVYNESPFLISTGDFPLHPMRYAFGTKYYSKESGIENDKKNRLRPRYGCKKSSGNSESSAISAKDGVVVAERPHSGMAFITLHPLDDYADKASNHVPSMNWESRIALKSEIVYERETSFYAYIPRGRLIDLYFAKYPRIFSSEYHEMYRFKYGLTKELYVGFYEGFRKIVPHSIQGRLLQKLLGEYLSAFATAIIYKRAHIRCKDDGQVLLFRNNFGGFSFVPTPQINPTPNGEDYSARLLRYYTDKKRRKLGFAFAQEGNNTGENTDNHENEETVSALKPEHKKRHIDPSSSKELGDTKKQKGKYAQASAFYKTKGDGDCAFHAIFGKLRHGMYECQDVEAKRKHLADAVYKITPEQKELYPLVQAAMQELIINGAIGKGTFFDSVKQAYQIHLRENRERDKEIWELLETRLKDHPEPMELINKYEGKKDFHEQYQCCLNNEQDGNKLRELISSRSDLKNAFDRYNNAGKEGFDWKDKLQGKGVLAEYSDFIKKPGQWLLPCELQIIAYVFEIEIDFYTTNIGTGEVQKIATYNSGKKEKVKVIFNGINHYERAREGLEPSSTITTTTSTPELSCKVLSCSFTSSTEVKDHESNVVEPSCIRDNESVLVTTTSTIAQPLRYSSAPKATVFQPKPVTISTADKTVTAAATMTKAQSYPEAQTESESNCPQ